MTAILNIGLNVGKGEGIEQLNLTLTTLAKYESILNLKVDENYGDWGNERTLIVEIQNSMGEHNFESLLKELCRILKQDAIAYKTSQGKVGIIYNTEYRGEIFEFNKDYFVEF